MSRLLSIFLVFCPAFVFAKPAYFNTMSGFYSGTQLTFSCNTCHQNGKGLNAYGREFAQVKNQIGFDQLRDVFAALGDRDSDGDGLTNNQEIAAGRNPGVAGK